MQSDFNSTYKDYSNTELLKILKQEADYQPAAVAAAQNILNSRIVSDVEKELVEQHFRSIDEGIKARQQKIDDYKKTATDFLEPVLQPTSAMHPAKWLKFVLLFLIIGYLWSFYDTVVHFVHIAQYSYHHRFDIDDFAEIFNLVYIPVFFFLLYKRNRWGWILLFANNLIIAISQIAGLIPYYFYMRLTHRTYGWPAFINTNEIVIVVLRIVFSFFLWSVPISDFFSVMPEVKKRTLRVSLIICAMLLFAFFLLMRFS